MKIVAHDKFANLTIIDATSVVVLDDYGNAVAGAIWHQPGHIQLAHVGDPDFELLIGLLGYDKVTVTDYQGEQVNQPCQALTSRLSARR